MLRKPLLDRPAEFYRKALGSTVMKPISSSIFTQFGLTALLAGSLIGCASTGNHNTESEQNTFENQKYYHPNCTHYPEGSATQRQCWADENYKEDKERQRRHERELLKRQADEINQSIDPLDTKKLGL